jgi:DNA-binding HxlR family transcriptional regulator
MSFRYAQFCPLARAAELLGERWTLLIVRELLMGPRRYSDLRRALPGVSASVLSERLARLEQIDIVTRGSLPPPAASRVYELAETGRALQPVVRELATWGARFLSLPLAGDDVPALAVRVSLSYVVRSDAVPERCFEVQLEDPDGTLAFRVVGSADGAEICDARADADAPDAIVGGAPRDILSLAAGELDLPAAIRDGRIWVEGDAAAAVDFPRLFDPSFQNGSGDAGPPN